MVMILITIFLVINVLYIDLEKNTFGKGLIAFQDFRELTFFSGLSLV
jgi:hypothetical protein